MCNSSLPAKSVCAYLSVTMQYMWAIQYGYRGMGEYSKEPGYLTARG